LLAYWGSTHTIQLWINQTVQILELCPNLIQKPFLVPNQYMQGYNPMKMKVYVSNHEAQLLASHLRVLMIKWGSMGMSIQLHSLDSSIKSFWKYLYLFGVISSYFIPSILPKLVVYICLSSYLLWWFRIPSITRQLYATCHMNEMTTPR
jgi:hypothetical protein